MMKGKYKKLSSEISRRDFVRQTTAGITLSVASSGPFFLFDARAQARQKTLKILQWKHFVPDYDKWFDDVFTRQWGEKHDTRVIVDHIPLKKINLRAAEEVKLHKGHDLVMFVSPPARYEKHVINHAEVYQQVAGRQGQVISLGHRSTFNPRTRKYFAFTDSYVPMAINYIKDYWAKVGYPFGPSLYEDFRLGSKNIRETLGVPCGLGLAPELDSNVALHALLWSFGESVQDERGNVTLNSRRTIQALNFVKTLQQESGTPAVFNWNPDSNDHALLKGKISSTMNAVSIARQAEREKPEMSSRIGITPTLRGPVNWLTCPHITSCYVIWEFAENKEGAKQFLVDLVDNLKVAFKVSGFCNFPCFPKTIPDLRIQLENDPRANPHQKYTTLEDALFWTTNIGHPGYATPAIDEVFNGFVIPRMFAAVAKGESSPEDSASAAEQEVKEIFKKWNGV
jgi:multiple sugar transport system substrate-binding protein